GIRRVKRGEASWSQNRKLADHRSIENATAEARAVNAPWQARSCHPCAVDRMRTEACRTCRSENRRPPDSGGPLVIADLIGKGKHIRRVPVPTWAKRAVDDWTGTAGIS